MARLRTFTRSDGSTVKVTPAEYERRSRLQRAALERRGLVVLTDKRGRQRGYAPELVAAEVARRARLAERARVRAEERRKPRPVEVYAAPVDPCDLDSLRDWIGAAIPALYDSDPRPGDRVELSAGADLVWASSALPAERVVGPRGAELAGWRHELIREAAEAAGKLCAQLQGLRPSGQANPGGGYRSPETVAIGTYDPTTGHLFVPDLPPEELEQQGQITFTLTLIRAT